MSLNISFSTGQSHPTSEKYRLLELADPLLQKAIEGGQKLYFKGLDDDELFLCTDECSFRVREVHSSNLILLLDNDKIIETTNNLLEPVRVPGKLERLKNWLDECPYEGPDSNELGNINRLRYDSNELGNINRLRYDSIYKDIQASDEEIKSFLSSYGAFLIDDHFRIFGPEYLCRFFKTLFSLCTLHEVSVTKLVQLDTLFDLFALDAEEFPRDIINNLLKIYGIIEMDHWRINESLVCRFFASELFRAKGIWNSSDLMTTWKSLTGDLNPSLSMLAGIAIMEPIPGSTACRLKYFPSSNLPMNPIERFLSLFDACPRWELSVLEPYIDECAKSLGVSTLDLIVKHARISVDPTSQRKVVTSLLPSL